MFKNRFFKNVSWLLVGNVFRMLFNLVANLIIARYLGPARQGIINYVATYTSFFISLVSLGINGVIIHEFVNHKEEGQIIGSCIALRLMASVLSMFAMIIIICVSDRGDPVLITVGFLQAVQLPFSALDTIKYWYQNKLQSKISVFVTSTAYLISCLYKVYILVSKKDVVWFGFASSLDIILIGILYLVSYKKNRGERLAYSGVVAKRVLRACLPFALANIMVFIYSKIDTIMIRHMLGSMELVGFYTTAVTVCNYISFVPTAILDSARPVIMSAKNENEALYEKRMGQSMLAVMGVAILYALGMSVLGGVAIRLLYGEAYMGALGSLKIAVWYTGFAFLGSVKSIWLICEKQNKYVIVFASMGAVTNVILNSIMIPIWGIEGAAIATLLTNVFTHIIYPCFFKDTRGFVRCVRDAILLKNVGLSR